MTSAKQTKARSNFKKAFAIVKKNGFKPFTKKFGAEMKKEIAKMKK